MRGDSLGVPVLRIIVLWDMIGSILGSPYLGKLANFSPHLCWIGKIGGGWIVL